MRKPMRIICIILLLLTGSLLFGAAPTLTVLPLEAKFDVEQNDIDAIYELLTTKIIKTGVFRVVENDPSIIGKLIEQQGFALSDFVNNDNVVKIGEILASQYVIIGSIRKIGNEYSLVIRLVEIATGVSEWADSLTEKSIKSLTKSLDQITKSILAVPRIGSHVMDEWGVELVANAMIMKSEFYAAGASLGVSRMTSSKFGTGIWGGVNLKQNGNIYAQGGVKFIARFSRNFSVTANIGVMPSVGVYIGSAYLDFSPLWIGGYDGFNVSAGYKFRF